MTIQINITIPDDLLEEVSLLAEQERRKRSNMIAVLVEEAIQARKVGIKANCYNTKTETMAELEKEACL